jgi:type I restriction enzyme S subunit
MTKNNQTKFKQTEIGLIPEDWEILKIKNIGQVVTGKTPPKSNPEYFGEITPFITPTDFANYLKFADHSARYLSENGKQKLRNLLIPAKSIIVTCIGSDMGKVAITEKESTTNQQINSIIYNKNLVDPNFVYYNLKNQYLMLKNIAHGGSTMPIINKTVFENIQLIFPSLPEQQKIADVLGMLDDKIEVLRKMNTTLESLGQAIFKNVFHHSELDLESRKLGELADISIGRTPPRKEEQWFSTDSNDIKWVSIKDMGNCGIFIDKTSEYLTKEAVEKFNVPIIPQNTLILSFKLTIGRLAITAQEMVSNEAIAHLKLKNGSISNEYLFFYLKNFAFSSLGSTSSIATAVNSQTIKGIDVAIPNNQVHEKFNRMIKPIFEKIRMNEKHIETLSQIRDSLLPRLMSGKLRVK